MRNSVAPHGGKAAMDSKIDPVHFRRLAGEGFQLLAGQRIGVLLCKFDERPKTIVD